MTAMGWFITADVGEFLAEAGEFLRAEPRSVGLTARIEDRAGLLLRVGDQAVTPPAHATGARVTLHP